MLGINQSTNPAPTMTGGAFTAAIVTKLISGTAVPRRGPHPTALRSACRPGPPRGYVTGVQKVGEVILPSVFLGGASTRDPVFQCRTTNSGVFRRLTPPHSGLQRLHHLVLDFGDELRRSPHGGRAVRLASLVANPGALAARIAVLCSADTVGLTAVSRYERNGSWVAWHRGKVDDRPDGTY
jgi:hypothetical protein